MGESQSRLMTDIVDRPIGDTVIRVGRGADAGLIRVHRNFLIIASPVFRVMLTGGFSESSRTLNNDDPLVLPEDDRAKFIDFCKVLHYQVITPSPTLDHIAEIAVIADKYGCSAIVLQPLLTPFRDLIDPFPQHGSDLEDSDIKAVLDLVLLSYIAKEKTLLWQSSRYAAINLEGQALKDGWNANLRELAPGVVAIVPQLRAALLENLQNYCGAGCERISSSSASASCSHVYECLGNYTDLLIKLKDGSNVDLSRSNMSLASAWGRFQTLAKDPSLKVCGAPWHQGWPCKIDLSMIVMDGIDRSQQEVRGVCLECEANGKALVEATCTHYGITQSSNGAYQVAEAGPLVSISLI